MVVHKYEKPRNKVIEVYRGKEFRERIEVALERVFAGDGVRVSPAKVKKFLRMLPKSSLGGEAVLIIEQSPMASMQARGKYGDKIYSVIGKTGTQRVKEYKKPRNPRSPAQQKQRGKIREAIMAWRMLAIAQRTIWNKKAKNKPLSGYNLFISNYLLTH